MLPPQFPYSPFVTPQNARPKLSYQPYYTPFTQQVPRPRIPSTSSTLRVLRSRAGRQISQTAFPSRSQSSTRLPSSRPPRKGNYEQTQTKKALVANRRPNPRRLGVEAQDLREGEGNQGLPDQHPKIRAARRLLGEASTYARNILSKNKNDEYLSTLYINCINITSRR